ncbi:hypothetical protein C9374_006399 [Naegleria lovaniensis]|uniref:Uncharacterized protein n=1 Tax=Naegleria lovaniensis TaxID=51637 RepID=A0AA88KJC9_NAELO|nr:uncharacterized protein C9374_006399 [Naegleria lovaniensis]KAG2381410.1 hypothetical protein C9374_006399 [Naegleria lovaniensis]
MSQQQQMLLGGREDHDEYHEEPHHHHRSSSDQTQKYSSMAYMMENSLVSLLLALFFFLIGVLNLVQYTIMFSTSVFPLTTVDDQLVLAYYITDMIFYASMVVMSVLLVFSTIAAAQRRWKIHLFLVLLYSIVFVMGMFLAIGSMSLSIVVAARKGQVGFAIIRSMLLAIMFCMFCAIVNCMFLPVKFRQSRREIREAHDYSML